MSFWKGKNQFKHIEIVPGGIFKGFGHVDPGGRVYYVNNITGASGAGGLSWNDAFAEPSQAITASETYRQLGGLAPAVSTNDYIRNTIVVQGTSTAYTALTDMGEHLNILGLGDNMLGNAAGIARVGPDTGNATYGVLTTETVRGLYLYNIQFQAGGLAHSVKFTNIYRTTFENCGLFVNGAPTQSPTYGFWVIGAASGLHIKDCHWGNAASASGVAANGLYINGTHFHNCIVEGSFIVGSAAGIYIGSSCINTHGTVVRNNYIGTSGSSTCTIGVDDNDTSGYTMYHSNYVSATTALDIENNGSVRCVGNMKYTSFEPAS